MIASVSVIGSEATLRARWAPAMSLSTRRRECGVLTHSCWRCDHGVIRPFYCWAYARGYTTAHGRRGAGVALAFDLSSGHPERRRAMRMSVIVCAHNEAQYLAACLHSLLAQ